MPLYEYRCTSCGYTFEKIQSFSAEPEKECPRCHGVLIRPVTAPALRFEGAGWYVNDYAGKGAAAKSGDADGGKAGDGKAESKSEAKADSKSESKPESGASAAPAASSAPASTPSTGS